jgi:hypothetical protein
MQNRKRTKCYVLSLREIHIGGFPLAAVVPQNMASRESVVYGRCTESGLVLWTNHAHGGVTTESDLESFALGSRMAIRTVMSGKASHVSVPLTASYAALSSSSAASASASQPDLRCQITFYSPNGSDNQSRQPTSLYFRVAPVNVAALCNAKAYNGEDVFSDLSHFSDRSVSFEQNQLLLQRSKLEAAIRQLGGTPVNMHRPLEKVFVEPASVRKPASQLPRKRSHT